MLSHRKIKTLYQLLKNTAFNASKRPALISRLQYQFS